MTTLRSTISQLANEFAAGVLEAIRGASLEQILAETGGTPARRGRPAAPPRAAEGGAPAPARPRRGGRLGRRSAKDIAALVEQIVRLLEAHPEGLRAEQIRQELGLEAKELPRPLTEALSSRRISKEGQKRATTYFARGAGGRGARGGGAASGGGGGRAPGRGAKRAGPRAKAAGAKRTSGKRAKRRAGGRGRRAEKGQQAPASTNGAQATS